jgi:hypothetical protein
MKLTPSIGGAYSGSFGGVTASHNKGGQYLRRRSVPTNPNTIRQQTVRSVMGGLVQTWSDDLTDPQREAWRVYAANTPVTDKLGQVMTLSGVNMFVRANSLRRIATALGLGDFPAVNDGPVVFNTGEGVVSVTQFSAVFTTPPGTLTLLATLGGAAPDDGLAFVFVAPPQTPGTGFFKGPYQLAATGSTTVSATDTDLTFVLDLATDWFAAIFPVAAWDGLAVPLRLLVVYDDGRVSQDFRALTEFTDATP